nr:unnamed protein product [Callosobruchus analis]CAI5863704.1 unnamed protein product [Callosobruchus analis]
MPSKKKKYNARFPAGRIKKIMQTDEEVGKVAQAVPVIISRTLELFVESLLTKSMQITLARNAKTLTPSHMKQCILSESRFDFLKDLVKDIPDASVQEDNENNLLCDDSSKATQREESEPMPVPPFKKAGNSKATRREKREERQKNTESNDGIAQPCPLIKKVDNSLDKPTTSSSSSSTSRTPVIQYGPSVAQAESTKLSFSVDNLLSQPSKPDTTDMRLTGMPVAIPSCSKSSVISATPIPE